MIKALLKEIFLLFTFFYSSTENHRESSVERNFCEQQVPGYLHKNGCRELDSREKEVDQFIRTRVSIQ